MAFVVGAGLVATGSRALAWETPAARQSAPVAAGKAKPAKKDAAKEVTLTGQLTCAKCGLHEAGPCQNVLVVVPAADGAGGSGATTAAGESAKYYLEKNAVARENHEKVCRGSVTATVTGRIHDEGGKKIITASSVKIDAAPTNNP